MRKCPSPTVLTFLIPMIKKKYITVVCISLSLRRLRYVCHSLQIWRPVIPVADMIILVAFDENSLIIYAVALQVVDWLLTFLTKYIYLQIFKGGIGHLLNINVHKSTL